LRPRPNACPDAEKIDAQLADGILTVRLPKATQARSRQIDIKD
jgi:HSP20 family molecular chaperone IbpA